VNLGLRLFTSAQQGSTLLACAYVKCNARTIRPSTIVDCYCTSTGHAVFAAVDYTLSGELAGCQSGGMTVLVGAFDHEVASVSNFRKVGFLWSMGDPRCRKSKIRVSGVLRIAHGPPLLGSLRVFSLGCPSPTQSPSTRLGVVASRSLECSANHTATSAGCYARVFTRA
jgi:hypothetical protein